MKKETGVSGMTTDAKIGLLLGLVFIVIIAFVLRGLPSLQHNNEGSDLTKKYIDQVGQQSIGLTDAPRKAMETVGPGANYVDVPIAKNNDASLADQSPIKPVNVAIETNTGAVAQQIESNGTEAMVAESAVVDPQTQKAANDALAQVAAEKAAAEQLQPQTVSSNAPQIYTVRKGDTLGSISVRFYGADGKQKRFIESIVKANHLKSAKQLSIDQKLIIPPPPKDLDSVEPSLFEKVQAMGKRAFGGAETNSTGAGIEAPAVEKAAAIAVAPDQGEYLVQSGDYLWKIASRIYGDGNRYKDIIKCNPGVLKTKDTPLSIGMRLKMPPK